MSNGSIVNAVQGFVVTSFMSYFLSPIDEADVQRRLWLCGQEFEFKRLVCNHTSYDQVLLSKDKLMPKAITCLSPNDIATQGQDVCHPRSVTPNAITDLVM